MSLRCLACGAPFSDEDVHRERGVANCRMCRCARELRPAEPPRPARFAIDESDGRMRIVWRWFRSAPSIRSNLIACSLLNRSRIVAGGDRVTVTHGPVPFAGRDLVEAVLERRLDILDLQVARELEGK